MSIRIEGDTVYGLELRWSHTSIELHWDEDLVELDEETCFIPVGGDEGAYEVGEDDEPLEVDWIRLHYEVCCLEPGLRYCQEVTVTVEEAIQLGIFSPAEEDPDLGTDGGISRSDVPILAALWAINRRAKRCRDLAQANYQAEEHVLAGHYKRWKEVYYRVKGQALHYLLAEKRLTVTGHHSFDDDLWAEVISGEGYTFHRPCPEQDDVDGQDRERIEAKPKEADEPAVADALATLLVYLEDKPEVAVYTWPAPSRSPRTCVAFEDDEDDYEYDDDDDCYDDDDYEYDDDEDEDW